MKTHKSTWVAVTCSFGFSVCATAQTNITIGAGEEPEVKQWTLPASISYVSNDGKEDSWAVDIAAKIEWQPDDNSTSTWFARSVFQRNTQQKNEVENYELEFGRNFDLDTATVGLDQEAWYFFINSAITVGDKTIFPDQDADCTGEPLNIECVEQNETYVRAEVSLQPFRSNWETTFGYEDSTHTKLKGPSWTRSFGPVLSLFHDEILDAKRGANGFKPDGGVTGLKLAWNAAFSPAITDYRLIVSARVQYINAFDRSSGRQSNFDRSTVLQKLAVDYEFGPRSFNSDSGWIPAVGITYTKGDDPLTGMLNQDNVVFGFRITYRPPK